MAALLVLVCEGCQAMSGPAIIDTQTLAADAITDAGAEIFARDGFRARIVRREPQVFCSSCLRMHHEETPRAAMAAVLKGATN